MLAERGSKVACAARATDAAPVPIPGTIDETVRKITEAGGDAFAVPTNLAKEAEVERMVASTIEYFGRVDLLVNNAAITFPGDLDLDMKRFDLVMNVDLRAPLQAIRAVMPSMKARDSDRRKSAVPPLRAARSTSSWLSDSRLPQVSVTAAVVLFVGTIP